MKRNNNAKLLNGLNKVLGSILPTEQSLAINDKWHKNVQQQMREKARILGLRPGSFQGLEQRYDESPSEYTVISSKTLQPITFVLKKGEWFRK